MKDIRSKQTWIDDHSTIALFPESTYPNNISYQQHDNKLQQEVQGEDIDQYTASFNTAKHVNRNKSGKMRLSGAISPLDSAFSPGCNKGIQGIPKAGP